MVNYILNVSQYVGKSDFNLFTNKYIFSLNLCLFSYLAFVNAFVNHIV